MYDIEKFTLLCNDGEMLVENFHLENVFLSNICVNSQTVRNVSFKNSTLINGFFLSAVFENCDFRNTDLSGAQLPFSRFVECTFDKNTVFDRSIISGSEFINCHYNDLALFSSENMPSQYELVSFTSVINKTTDLGFDLFEETLNDLSKVFNNNPLLTVYRQPINNEDESGVTYIIQSSGKFTLSKQCAFNHHKHVCFYQYLNDSLFADIVYIPSWHRSNEYIPSWHGFNEAVIQLISRLPLKLSVNNQRVRLCSDILIADELGANPLETQFKNIDFSNIEFTNCKFKGVFINCNFYHASFTNCDFSQAALKNCVFDENTFTDIKPDKHGVIEFLIAKQAQTQIEISTRYFVVSYAYTLNSVNTMTTSGIITEQGMFNLASLKNKLSEIKQGNTNFALMFYNEMTKDDFNDMFASDKNNIIMLR